MNDLLLARRDFLSQADWTIEAAAYVAAHGIDMEAVERHAGILAIINCEFGYPIPEPGVVIEVYGEDDETTIDLCAWPVHYPERFATFLGAAALGLATTCNPATWAMGGVLRVFRTPLRWLQAGCQGCVVLDHRYVPAWLGQALGPIQAEDLEHARQLHSWLNPRFDRRRILVPRTAERRAA